MASSSASSATSLSASTSDYNAILWLTDFDLEGRDDNRGALPQGRPQENRSRDQGRDTLNSKKRLTGPSRTRPRVKASKNHSMAAEEGLICDSREIGTGLAIQEPLLSSPTTTLQPTFSLPVKGRGRRSTSLRLREVENIIAAAVYTVEKQCPLNRHTTVHFVAAGVLDPIGMIGAYMHLAGDWLRTQGAVLAYIWVRENGERKGEHVHIAMHVPPHLSGRFAERERGWRKQLGIKRVRGACHTTPIGRSYLHAFVGTQYGSDYSDDLRRFIGYVLKGADERAAKALGLTRLEPGGEIFGKRTGMSENINRTVRQRAPLK